MLQLFSHIALNCKDPAATESFYTKHFGFRRARLVQAGEMQVIFLKMQDCAVYLELFKAEGECPQPPAEKDGYSFPGVRHLAFKVCDVEAKLKEMGSDLKLTLGPLEFNDFIPGWKSAWLADPDGRIIEISQGFTDQFPEGA